MVLCPEGYDIYDFTAIQHPSDDLNSELITTHYDFNFGVKISGSGGGGYVLGFTDDVEKASDLLKDFEVIWL